MLIPWRVYLPTIDFQRTLVSGRVLIMGCENFVCHLGRKSPSKKPRDFFVVLKFLVFGFIRPPKKQSLITSTFQW